MLNKKQFRAPQPWRLCPWHPYFSDCRSGDSTWDDHRVKHRHHFDCVPGGCGVGRTVEEEDGAGEDADGGQAGGAGWEGFAATTGWTHVEDGDNNKHIRQENDEECADHIKSGKNEKQPLVEISIRARRESREENSQKWPIVLKHRNDNLLTEHMNVKEQVVPQA